MDMAIFLIGALLVAFVIGVPVTLLLLMSRVGDLRKRIAQLEAGAPLTRTVPVAPLSDQATEPATVAPTPPPIPARSVPWPAAAATAAPIIVPPEPREPGLVENLGHWLATNWFYAGSAVSLGLAGLFMVQYGIENGLIPPVVRVLAALGFGAALIAGGEYLRRRFGAVKGTTTGPLPAVFSAAGIVSLFGGIVSARLLYGLIGPELALIGLAGTAVLAMGLGWFNGPLLAAVGVVGGFVAPMIVGGASTDPTWLYAYFATIAGLGLGIDTLRRWGWVSGLSVALAFVMGGMLYSGPGNTGGALAIYVFVIAMFSVLIPCRALAPDHQGPTLSSGILSRVRPIFPVFLAAAALALASGTLAMLSAQNAETFWLCVTLLSVLGIAWILWSDAAPALQDQAILPLAGLFWAVLHEGERVGPVVRPLADLTLDPAIAPAGPGYPMAITALVALGGLWSLAAAWRSWRGGNHPAIWAGAAALVAPLLAILLDMVWHPLDQMGPYNWALHAAAIAAGMVFLAEKFGRKDGTADRLRVGLFALSALSALAFACVILLSSAALTVAIVVAVVAAAWLDRRFDLPAMTLFIGAGALTIGYRLLADPGLGWAVDTGWPAFGLAYGGAFAGMVGALSLSRLRARTVPVAILDSAGWSIGGMFAALVIYRVIDGALGGTNAGSHWAVGLFASIWFGMALAQLNIAHRVAGLRWLRHALAGIFGLLGVAAILTGLTAVAPLVVSWSGRVQGPALFNTLIPAYLLPAIVLGFGAWRIGGLPNWLRRGTGTGVVALAAYWLFTAIRHFWQGADRFEIRFGFSQPEISTYTVAVLILGAGLFYQSLARGDATLRRAGLVVIGVAVAKVFLIDMGSLGGLTRVFSFLLLGFALAGLAWLNTWAQANEKARGDRG